MGAAASSTSGAFERPLQALLALLLAWFFLRDVFPELRELCASALGALSFGGRERPAPRRPALLAQVCAELHGSRVRGPVNLEVALQHMPRCVSELQGEIEATFRAHLTALSSGAPGIERAPTFSIRALYAWESDAAGWRLVTDPSQIGVLDQLYAARGDEGAPAQHRSELPAARTPAVPRERLGEPLLPPQSGALAGRLTVVLDLDETLLHRRGREEVLYRPHWEELLEALKDIAEVVLWTASKEDTLPKVLRTMDPRGDRFHHRICRDDRWFTSPFGQFDPGVKDLSMLGRPISRCVIVDNSVGCVERNPEHAVVVPSYEAEDPQDATLVVVRRLLQWAARRAGTLSVPELLLASREVVPACAPADEQPLPYHHYRPSPVALEEARRGIAPAESEPSPGEPKVYEVYEVRGRFFQVMGFTWDPKEGDYCVVSRPLYHTDAAFHFVPTRTFGAYENITRMVRVRYCDLDEVARGRVKTGCFWLDPDWRLAVATDVDGPATTSTVAGSAAASQEDPVTLGRAVEARDAVAALGSAEPPEIASGGARQRGLDLCISRPPDRCYPEETLRRLC
eukprot:TRINITY_DN4010_c2_g1_i1.p1 TRINITY_DN4010_c2_g1~~TRINITY_DN4010_c2_g1_i1.p1  ORF type:complete len:597 (+),score=164.51 TRINITY_DN4010_c2_g1_i1:81-1793(+)